MANIGLVLSGGGARAAYQVGALYGIAEVLPRQRFPFRVLAGISAGAINCASLATGAGDFRVAAARLREIWQSLHPNHVYRTDATRLATVGARWLKDISTGGVLGASRVNHLLDTTPLRELLTRELQMKNIRRHIRSGLLRGVALTTTNYATGTTVTFFDAAPSVEPWVRRSRIALREVLTTDHVIASAAIPIFFPPVKLGSQYHGDGGVRMSAPISPVIHLGAEKVLSIGIRYSRPADEMVQMNQGEHMPIPTVSDIGGVLLNALFLDALDNDVERLERVNRTLNAIPDEFRPALKDPLRRVPSLALRPSKDLGQLAADQYQRFPLMLRHLLRGIGATETRGWELVSYLAFHPEYVNRLIQLGYEDALDRKEEIVRFFQAPVADSAPPSVMPPPVRLA